MGKSPSCKCGNNIHIQTGYPEPCKIPGSDSCKACMCLLNGVPLHRRLPLEHWHSLQLGSSMTVINDAIEK